MKPYKEEDINEGDGVYPTKDAAFPIMTSANSPAPYVITSTNGGSLYQATSLGLASAFTWGSGGVTWSSYSPKGVQIDLGSIKKIKKVSAYTGGGNYTLNLVISASNNNSTFTTLVTFPTVSGTVTRVQEFSPYAEYRYWRFQNTAGTSWCCIGDIKIYKA